MKNPPPRLKYWILGSLVAFAGVIVKRVAAPHADPSIGPWVNVAGLLIATAGLALIAVGGNAARHASASPEKRSELAEGAQ